jgi:16S rRNA (adenine1518-N6/adenine1519-N6)-dimethyltransferase
MEGAARVVAIDVDPRAIDALAEVAVAASGRLDVISGDALDIDLPVLLQTRALPKPWAIVANLPYNVGTALLLRWLADGSAFSTLVLMFQREVADRLLATPGGKNYSRLSVMAQWGHVVERCFNLPASAFTPPPKVASTVVRLTPRETPLAPAARDDLETVTGAAFGQRRKMLRQSLKALPADTATLLAEAGIDGARRAEDLSVEEHAALARAFRTLRG